MLWLHRQCCPEVLQSPEFQPYGILFCTPLLVAASESYLLKRTRHNVCGTRAWTTSKASMSGYRVMWSKTEIPLVTLLRDGRQQVACSCCLVFERLYLCVEAAVSFDRDLPHQMMVLAEGDGFKINMLCIKYRPLYVWTSVKCWKGNEMWRGVQGYMEEQGKGRGLHPS